MTPTPVPLWPTPTPLPVVTPQHPIELNFELGQDFAYSAVQFWQTADSGGMAELIQIALLGIVLFFGIVRVVNGIKRL